MTDREDLILFAKLAQSGLKDWTEREMAKVQAQLLTQTDPMAIYRSQGQGSVLATIQKYLAVAPELVSKM
jgi:hypothetical protein